MILSYVAYRVLLYIPTLLVIFFIVFSLVKLLPGDPIVVMYGELAPPPEVRKALEEKLGLDKPFIIQFLLYTYRILTGDWGKSVHTGEPILELVIRRFTATLELTVASLAIASATGITLAYIAVMRPNSIVDRFIGILSMAGYSMPVFWWGMILIFIFAVNLKLLPPGGRGGLESLILPSLTLATVNFGMIARVSRAAMLEVYSQDFVMAARSRGLSERRVVVLYVMRNAAVAIATLVGLRFGILMGGAVITETVFNYPGVGRMIVDGILARDYPVVFGGVVFVALVVMTVNLVVDLLYAILDPRARVTRV
ncbi:MAG: ABC transporter permease [Desulfurococcales archaeon]|jgi:ABC-type dipeptide/oligopeptide/nickel transport system permease component|nr:ABC transporter permease [Desulfurococcaceae archaeon]MCC6060159.1 ABC transporter permease [Desulfurococcaceae archaeon]MDT7865822.1 ABC transporter permease [Desulfurococcales archaeon]